MQEMEPIVLNAKIPSTDKDFSSFDKALKDAMEQAGDLGSDVQSMYDPETGTLIGQRSADGRRGWRLDGPDAYKDDYHINWWNWPIGNKRGGSRGHNFYPQNQAGPSSMEKDPDNVPWESSP